MQKLIHWSKRHIFPVSALFLIAFIPLFPKLPLFDIVQTWVYIRLEDFLVALVNIALAVRYLRKRKWPDTPLTVPIAVYLGIGLLSLLWAIAFIFPDSQGQLFAHLGVLHYLRRIEYMSLFFLGFEAIRDAKELRPFVAALSVTYLLVIIYGVGQKFLGWPAFLTMNEEFAKGVPLQLPPTARIASTFGGHYDLAAYLVMTIPLFAALAFGVRRWGMRILFGLLALGGLELLLLTASRVSFGVYLVSITVMLFWQKRKLFIIPVWIVSFVLLNVIGGASERFYKTFRMSDVVVDLSTGRPIGTLESIEGGKVKLEEIERPDEENLPKGSGFINIASGNKGAQYYANADIVAKSGEIATVSGSFLVQKALVYDISFTTRLQGQWPKAIAAFDRNPLLGSGYSSLSVAADGDYFRMLGETGIAGTIAFLAVIAASFSVFFRRRNALRPFDHAFVNGFYGGMVGILLNAVLIDVFEASKVAFSMWLIMGIAIGVLTFGRRMDLPYIPFMKKLLMNPYAIAAAILAVVITVWRPMFSMYFVADDFTWLRWAATGSFGDIGRYFTDAAGFFYRPVPKIWYLFLYSFFWLKPWGYYLGTFVLVSITAGMIYAILRMRSASKLLSLAGAVIFILLSVHHENIMWISGQSSLLAGLFLAAAMALRLLSIRVGRKTGAALSVLSFPMLLMALFSYDGIMTAPIATALVSLMILKRRIYLMDIALIGIYWLMRSGSGAVFNSGDYAYNIAKLPLNAAGNGLIYLTAFFLGPKAVEAGNMIRGQVRLSGIPIWWLLAGGGVSLAVVVAFFRKGVGAYKEPIVWAVSGVILLGGYLGLGLASERYLYVASIFGVIALMLAAGRFASGSKVRCGLALLAGSLLVLWNVQQTRLVSEDWLTASRITEDTLLKIKERTFPPLNIKWLFFFDTPIRYGRAWVFPTGLEDPLWHIFRENPYHIISAPDYDAAFSYTIPGGDREVFQFDGYELRRVTVETEKEAE